jgi:hypothetical protein
MDQATTRYEAPSIDTSTRALQENRHWLFYTDWAADNLYSWYRWHCFGPGKGGKLFWWFPARLKGGPLGHMFTACWH